MTTIDHTCPGCGVHWGRPRIRLSRTSRARRGLRNSLQRVPEDVATPTSASRWVSKRTGRGMTTSRCIPMDAPCPEAAGGGRLLIRVTRHPRCWCRTDP